MFENKKYREFCEEVSNNINDYLPEEYQGVNIYLYEAVKNNGVKRIGLTFEKEKSKASPTIYLEEYYEMRLEGSSIAEICEQIIKLYEHAMKRNVESDALSDYEKVKKSVFLTMVNYEKNKKMLEDIPHIVINDLAVYFRAGLLEDEELIASIVIKNEMLKTWGITQKELQVPAYENTRKFLRPKLSSMRSIVERRYENLFESGEPDKDEMMFVLSSHNHTYGAVMAFFADQLEEARKIIKKDFYILPSSIHEMILVPKDSGMDPVYLGAMVREVNETQVKFENQLGDHVYEVGFDTDEMELVSVKESMIDWKE